MRGGFFTAAGAQFDFGASITTMVNGQLALQTNLQWTAAGPVTQQLTGLGAQIQSQVNNTVAKNLAAAGIASPLVTTPTVTASVSPSNTSAAAAAVTSSPVTTVATSATPSPLANTIVAQATAPVTTDAIAAATTAPSGSPTAATTAAPSTANVATTITTPSDGSATLTGIQVPGPGGSTQVFANIGNGQIQDFVVNSASGQTITQNTNISLTIYNFQAWQAQMANQMVAARLAADMMTASGLSLGL